jgi:hypothetical protein
MVMDVGASPEGGSTPGDSAPGDSDGAGPDGPVLPVGDPDVDAPGVVDGDVEVHAEITSSNAMSGTAGARLDPIPGTLSSPDGKPGNACSEMRQRFLGGDVSGGTVRPCAESSINVASRRSRVSSLFALITQ